MSRAWDVVDAFEQAVATFSGARYAVAVDSCTSAIRLCLAYAQPRMVTLPAHTYISVPMAVLHAGLKPEFHDHDWSGGYWFGYNIFDGARRMRRNMYDRGLHCLSFHARKLLPIGRGGMILTSSSVARDWFRRARYDGRHPEIPFMDDKVDMLGWNCYMTPEQAARGLQLLEALPPDLPDQGGSEDYPDLREMPIFGGGMR